MSGPQARPFKGRLGFDANNDKVVNLADPTDLQDGMNLRYFIGNNTTQTFDPTRGYPAGFIVEYDNRLFKTKTQIGAGPFNLNQWTEIHAFGRWLRITGAYQADPGDNLFVSTQAGAVTVSLPNPAEDGDIVTIVDEGFAKTTPIGVNPGTYTINNVAGNYSINSQDICQFVYLGGTWKVSREEKITYGVLDRVILTPNSYNLVPSAVANKTVSLPPAPINGQWVTLVDSTNDGSNYYTNVMGNGNVINGQASFVMNRNGSQATFVFDSASNMWKVASNQGERKMANTLFPLLPSQSVYIPLTNVVQTLNLPTASGNGDWVEIVATAQDGITSGSIVVTAPAGTYFRTNGSTINTAVFRITRRGKTTFVMQNGEWAIIQLENQFLAPTISNGSMTKNSTQVLKGSASDIIYLPPTDTVQVGDIITTQMVTDTGRIVVSVQNSSTEIVDGQQTLTYQASDYGIVVSFVYRGWDGAKNAWKIINHGVAYAQKTLNLADLPNKADARTNLDVFSKGESDLRFLALHGTADNALQAANADKLDGLHGYEYIKVANPSATAVDANTTSETRFTTNTNTPDSTMWLVVMFTDAATGSKSQIAMNQATNQIAYRSFVSSWSAWSRLDQGANAASATKLQTPRTINGVNFDGTANITVLANPKMNAILQNADMNSFVSAGFYNCSTTGVAQSLTNLPTAVAFSMVVVESTGSGATQTIREYGETLNKSWFRSIYNGVWTQWFRIYDEANPQPNIGGSSETANRWTTARTLSLSGGATGSVSFDGSANVTLNVSLTPAANQFAISNTNGLQDALNGKLGTGDAAANSTALAGIEGGSYKLGVTSSNSSEDPNTTLTTTILTNHSNTPDGGVSFWYIDTEFYAARSAGSNKFQTAKQYTNGVGFLVRNQYGGTWSAWTSLATNNFPSGTTAANWYRSTGASGWVSDTYGGGIYMTDTTWVRVYGSKALLVSNDIAATGNVTAYYSDARLKENLKVIPNALETVKSWTGYTYNANAKAKEFGYDTEKNEIGLMAQDIQKTTPEAVEQAPFDRTDVKGESLTGEHYLTLKYERLVPVLVEAIKEQDAQIQELKQQVASLLEAFQSLGK